MAKVNSMLSQRLKSATEKLSKMTDLVEMSSSGNLSSFSGVFRVSALNEQEKGSLHDLLNQFVQGEQETSEDLNQLALITAEVKAINNQAIILHGERIKKAQGILKKYRDGAFSAWLVATYGNRQTPYNFLQYYELYLALPHSLHEKLEAMPRQAVYSLASREGSMERKRGIVESYQGEPKQALLELIRKTFPLSVMDQRAQNLPEILITALKRLHEQINTVSFRPSAEQRKKILKQLRNIESCVEIEGK
ncbi:MAG: CT583 family protein [Bacteroidetes bacterium]|nr:CT583 family protein [Bacteroidota bacterium]